MNRSLLVALALLVALSGALLGQPTLTSISPTQTTAGAAAFTMTLNGTGFVGGTVTVNFRGSVLTPLTTASTQVTVQITSALIAVPGTADVSVTVSPLNQAPLTSGSRPFTINSAPAIATTSPLPSGVLGSPYFQTLAATGGTPSLIWSVVSGALPPGLTLSLGSGAITGTPTTPGAYRFTARVTDAQGFFAERTFDLRIVQSGTTQGPDGTVGVAYSATLVATSGTGPWSWAITSGQLPPGLTLNSGNGIVSGIPTTAGISTFVAQWADSQGLIFPNTFSIAIVAPTLTITTSSPLPNATAGSAYSQAFAVTGGISPYTWSISSGTPPSGLTLSAAGVLSGTPTQSGAFSFTVRVDASGAFATKAFSLTVNVAALTITTASPLPNGVAGTAYSQTFAATGGISPYTWSVPQGGLQTGLALSGAGLLSGTPAQGGASNFTVSVADASGLIATKVFTLTVTVPSATVSITGLTDTVNPAQQTAFDVQLGAAYPLTITGTIILTFRPNAIYPSDDPAIQFSAGGRTLTFTIPAGQISAFPTTSPSVQTGTVAGQIDMTLSNIFAGGQNITPANLPVRSMTIARTAPKINSVQVVKGGKGFSIVVTGFSPPRQVVQADFTFSPAAGANLDTAHVTVIVDPAFTIWYTGTSSPEYGSQFTYTQPFSVQGNVSDIGSVSVTLAHSTGTSTAVSATF